MTDPIGEVTARRPGWRALRIGVLGSASLLLATTAHLTGGGGWPTPGVMIVSAVILGLIGVLITGQRCRMPLTLAVLSGEQLALHLLFGATIAPTACAAGGTAHHAALSCPSVPSTMVTPMSASPGWSMWAAHAAAVLITAWLLSRGEAWLWRTADRIVEAASAAPGPRLRTPRESPVESVVSIEMAWSGHRPAAPRGPPVSV